MVFSVFSPVHPGLLDVCARVNFTFMSQPEILITVSLYAPGQKVGQSNHLSYEGELPIQKVMDMIEELDTRLRIAVAALDPNSEANVCHFFMKRNPVSNRP